MGGVANEFTASSDVGRGLCQSLSFLADHVEVVFLTLYGVFRTERVGCPVEPDRPSHWISMLDCFQHGVEVQLRVT